MEEWQAPAHQQAFADRSVTTFGYDNTSQTTYSFNKYGFRSPAPTNQDSVIGIGNSIAFGIGVDQTQTYLYKVAQSLSMPLINLSYGCYRHENHDNLKNIEIISQRNNNDLIVIQINNLSRKRISSDFVVDSTDQSWCINRFCDWFDQCQELLKSKNTIWLYWDDQEYPIPESIKKQILIYNKLHMDQSLPEYPATFGPKSHHAISKVITSRLKYCKVAPA